MTAGVMAQTNGGENLKLHPSYTTLSTIAIQAGQSQITISVLRVGTETSHITPQTEAEMTANLHRCFTHVTPFTFIKKW